MTDGYISLSWSRY